METTQEVKPIAVPTESEPLDEENEVRDVLGYKVVDVISMN